MIRFPRLMMVLLAVLVACGRGPSCPTPHHGAAAGAGPTTTRADACEVRR